MLYKTNPLRQFTTQVSQISFTNILNNMTRHPNKIMNKSADIMNTVSYIILVVIILFLVFVTKNTSHDENYITCPNGTLRKCDKEIVSCVDNSSTYCNASVISLRGYTRNLVSGMLHNN